MASKTKHKKSGGSLTPSKVAKHAPFPKHVYVTQDIPAICRALRTPATLAMRETKSGEVMVETKSEPPAALKNLLRDLLAPRSGRSGMMYRGRISLNGAIIANSGLGKYLQFWSASTSLLWNAVSTAAEFTTLDVLFDEFSSTPYTSVTTREMSTKAILLLLRRPDLQATLTLVPQCAHA